MRDVVLVKLPSYTNLTTPPLGIGYLLQSIRSLPGIRPVFIDAHRDRITDDQLIRRLAALNPLLIGFQVFSVEYGAFRRLLPWVGRLAESFCLPVAVAAGGPHVSGAPDETLRANPCLDFIVKGEGEEALPRIVRSLRDNAFDRVKQDIPNLVYRDGDRIVHTPSVQVDVNRHDTPDWEMLAPDKYPPVQHGTFHKSLRVVPLLTSRGCPFHCTYCAGHLITGRAIRLRDPSKVADEIEFLRERYGFEEFIVEDENFSFYPEHVFAFADEIRRRGIKAWFSFPNGLRPDRVDEDVVRAMKAMGAYMVALGVESASPRTLKAMGKNWDLSMVREKIRLFRRYGIFVHAHLMLGFPGETVADMRRTVRFALKADLDTAYFGNYIPLPGTADFRRRIELGEIRMEEIDWGASTSYYGRVPYHPPGVSARELLRIIRTATLRFYLRPRVLTNLLKRLRHPIMLHSLLFRASSLFRNHPLSSPARPPERLSLSKTVRKV